MTLMTTATSAMVTAERKLATTPGMQFLRPLAKAIASAISVQAAVHRKMFRANELGRKYMEAIRKEEAIDGNVGPKV